MFDLSVITEFMPNKITASVERASFRNLAHASASIRKTAQASIEKSSEPSAPGSPPHTRGKGRKSLRSAIRFDATKEDAVVGPVHSAVGEAGEAHEFGGEFRGDDYPERAFMGPALEASLDKFAAMWAGTIGE